MRAGEPDAACFSVYPFPATRGHKVTLFEKDAEIGGQVSVVQFENFPLCSILSLANDNLYAVQHGKVHSWERGVPRDDPIFSSAVGAPQRDG